MRNSKFLVILQYLRLKFVKYFLEAQLETRVEPRQLVYSIHKSFFLSFCKYHRLIGIISGNCMRKWKGCYQDATRLIILRTNHNGDKTDVVFRIICQLFLELTGVEQADDNTELYDDHEIISLGKIGFMMSTVKGTERSSSVSFTGVQKSGSLSSLERLIVVFDGEGDEESRLFSIDIASIRNSATTRPVIVYPVRAEKQISLRTTILIIY